MYFQEPEIIQYGLLITTIKTDSAFSSIDLSGDNGEEMKRILNKNNAGRPEHCRKCKIENQDYPLKW